MKILPLLFWGILAVSALARSPTPPQPAAPPPAPTPPPEAHHFDFWIGDWDVYAFGTETKIGENRIESIAGGFGLLENWKALAGRGEGKSINSYHAGKKQWQQYWVGSFGATTEYKGGLVDGKMVMTAESTTPTGAKILQRGTWSPQPDGSVRQQFEVSRDDGKTWQSSFDGHYRRKGSR